LAKLTLSHRNLVATLPGKGFGDGLADALIESHYVHMASGPVLKRCRVAEWQYRREGSGGACGTTGPLGNRVGAAGNAYARLGKVRAYVLAVGLLDLAQDHAQFEHV